MFLQRPVVISQHLTGRFAHHALLVASIALIYDLGEVMPFLILSEVTITSLGVKEFLPVLVVALGSYRLVRQGAVIKRYRDIQALYGAAGRAGVCLGWQNIGLMAERSAFDPHQGRWFCHGRRWYLH